MINRRGNTRIEWYDVDVLLWGSIVPPEAGTGPRYWDVWGTGPRGQKQQPYLDIGISGLYVRKFWATQLFVQENYASGTTSGLHGGFHTQVSGLYPASGFNLATKAYVDFMVAAVSGGGGGSTSLSGLTDVSGVWTSGTVVSWDGFYFVPAAMQASGNFQLSGNYITQAEGDIRYALSGTTGGSGTFQEGSGLYDAGGITHVGQGYGITVTNSGVMVNTTQLDSRYTLSGNGSASSGNWEISGTSQALAASLPALYQASGYLTEGSGLYQVGPIVHVGAGWGITVSDSGVTAKASDLDVRYALSGSGGGGTGTVVGTGTSGTLPVFNSPSGLIDSIVSQLDLGTNYALVITDPYTGGNATLIPDYYSLGFSRLYSFPPVSVGFGAFLVGSQNSGITGRVPYYSEAALIDNSEWKFSTTSLLSGIDLQAISGTFQKLSVRGQDTDARYALSGVYALSGTSYSKLETDTLYQLSGTGVLSGTSYTKTEEDARYVNVTGDTMTGPLYISGSTNAAQLKISQNSTQQEPIIQAVSGVNELFRVHTNHMTNLYIGSLAGSGSIVKAAGNFSGRSNLLIGANAGKLVTSGWFLLGIGAESLANCTIGSYLTAVGEEAMNAMISGRYSVAIGQGALSEAFGGDDNVAVGQGAGIWQYGTEEQRYPQQCVFVGSAASADNTNPVNVISIGTSARAFADNQVVLGNDLITQTILYGQVHTSGEFVEGSQRLIQKYALSGTGGGSGTTTLSGCTDVLYNHALTSGEVLSYNGTKWTNATAGTATSTPEELHRKYLPSGETLSVPARQQVLVYGSYEIEAGAVLDIQPSGELVILQDHSLGELDIRYALSGSSGGGSGSTLTWLEVQLFS